jgi:hypothetical protein
MSGSAGFFRSSDQGGVDRRPLSEDPMDNYLHSTRSRTIRRRVNGALLCIATAACLLALGYLGSRDGRGESTALAALAPTHNATELIDAAPAAPEPPHEAKRPNAMDELDPVGAGLMSHGRD